MAGICLYVPVPAVCYARRLQLLYELYAFGIPAQGDPAENAVYPHLHSGAESAAVVWISAYGNRFLGCLRAGDGRRFRSRLF